MAVKRLWTHLNGDGYRHSFEGLNDYVEQTEMRLKLYD